MAESRLVVVLEAIVCLRVDTGGEWTGVTDGSSQCMSGRRVTGIYLLGRVFILCEV
jgi:hypothetical protein